MSDEPTRAEILRQRMLSRDNDGIAIPSFLDFGTSVGESPAKKLGKTLGKIDRGLNKADSLLSSVENDIAKGIDQGIAKANVALNGVRGDISTDIYTKTAAIADELYKVPRDIATDLDLQLAEIPNILGPEIMSDMESMLTSGSEEADISGDTTADAQQPEAIAAPSGSDCPLKSLSDFMASVGVGFEGSDTRYWYTVVSAFTNEGRNLIASAGPRGTGWVQQECGGVAGGSGFITTFLFGPGVPVLFGENPVGNARFNDGWEVVPISLNPSYVELPPKSPTPAPIPTPVPKLPPKEPGCIPICGWPPTDRMPQEPEDCCDKAVKLYLNTETCDINAWLEGCGPPRPKFGEPDPWVPFPQDSTDWCQWLEEMGCREKPKDEEPTLPPKVPRTPPGLPPGLQAGQLCDFIPGGAILESQGVAAWLVWLADQTGVLNALDKADSPGSGIVKLIIETLASVVTNSAAKLGEAADAALQQVSAMIGCNPAVQGQFRGALALLGMLNILFQGAFDDLALPILQQARFDCPTGIPTPPEANLALLSDKITPEVWRCWIRANNQDEAKYETILQSQRQKFSPGQLARLYARGNISKERYAELIRELGFIEVDDVGQNYLLTENLPGQSDIIRMMVRDSADEEIAQRFGTDSDFDNKFTGRVRDYAEWQRVPEEVMRLVWRAHWQIPSPTALGEYVQRFRNVSGVWPHELPAEFNRADAASLLATRFGVNADVANDVVAALEQQDILPKWIPLTVLAMFRPPTRVDTRRQLEQGIIDRSTAEENLAQIGYAPDQATNIAELGERTARARAVKHPAVKRFADGEITESQLRTILAGDSIAPRYHEFAIERGHLEAKARSRKRCIAALQRRYLLGEMDTTQLRADLSLLGLAIPEYNALADKMECERQARGPRRPARELCQWFTEGLINSVEHFDRLIRLGWSRDDAVRRVRYCEILYQRKLDAEQRRQLAARKRAEKEAEREAEKALREMEQRRRQALREVKANQQQAKQRQRLMGRIADKLADRLGVTVVAAKRIAEQVFDAVSVQNLVTPDELLLQMSVAVADEGIEDAVTYEAAVSTLVAERVFPAAPPEEDLR